MCALARLAIWMMIVVAHTMAIERAGLYRMICFGMPLRRRRGHNKNVTVVNRKFVNWRPGWHDLGYHSFGLGMSSCRLVLLQYTALSVHIIIITLIFANGLLFCSSSYIYIYSLSQNPDHKLIRWLCSSPSSPSVAANNYSTSEEKKQSTTALLIADQYSVLHHKEQHMEL